MSTVRLAIEKLFERMRPPTFEFVQLTEFLLMQHAFDVHLETTRAFQVGACVKLTYQDRLVRFICFLMDLQCLHEAHQRGTSLEKRGLCKVRMHSR